MAAVPFCGYCQRATSACTCPPWMPNTGSELERAQRAVRAGWLPKLTAEARERFTKLIAEAAQ